MKSAVQRVREGDPPPPLKPLPHVPQLRLSDTTEKILDHTSQDLAIQPSIMALMSSMAPT